MYNNDPTSISWNDWDWRPLMRVVVWLALGCAWLSLHGMLSLAAAKRLASELALGWLLSFGLLTYLQILAATCVLRLALAADDFAYDCAERIVTLAMPRATFARTFLAAFALELALVLLAIRIVNES